MRIKSIFRACAGVLLTLLLSVSVFSCVAYADDGDDYDTYQSDGGFYTERYDVTVNVREDNVYSVTNKIKVNFYQRKHGIYFYTPYKGEVTRVIDGETVTKRFRAQIKNIAVNGGDYQTDYSDGCLVVQIGDEDKTVIGEQTYTISYDYILPDDGIDGMDEFYFNVLPQNWQNTIQKSKVTVNMPKEFESQNAFLYVGNNAYASGESSFSSDGKTVSAELESVRPGVGATVRINLPEGYYTGEMTYDGLIWASVLLPVAAALIVFALYLLFGRNKKIFPTVEFYPPEGTTSAEVGYIIDGIIDNKDLISLLIYWADKGYIAIETRDSDAFTLTRLRGMPAGANEYERTMFDGIFRTGTVVKSEKLQNSFYKTLAESKAALQKSIETKKQKAFTTASSVCRAVACLLAGAPIGAYLAIMGYVAVSNVMLLGLIAFGITSLLGFLYSFTYQARFGLKRSSLVARVVVCYVGFFAAMAITVLAGVFVFGQLASPLLICALTVFIIRLCVIMPTRTEESYSDLAKILGLREFIKTAELDRIEKLSKEDPEYFYHVLPYAYVLGLSDSWAKQFESISVPPPQWYYGYNGNMFNTILFMNAFNRSMNSANYVMTSVPQSKGSGGLGGSGFGGGFSGGGFGGGGGGSW